MDPRLPDAEIYHEVGHVDADQDAAMRIGKDHATGSFMLRLPNGTMRPITHIEGSDVSRAQTLSERQTAVVFRTIRAVWNAQSGGGQTFQESLATRGGHTVTVRPVPPAAAAQAAGHVYEAVFGGAAPETIRFMVGSVLGQLGRPAPQRGVGLGDRQPSPPPEVPEAPELEEAVLHEPTPPPPPRPPKEQVAAFLRRQEALEEEHEKIDVELGPAEEEPSPDVDAGHVDGPLDAPSAAPSAASQPPSRDAVLQSEEESKGVAAKPASSKIKVEDLQVFTAAKPPVGLKNLSSICYLNSILQQLFMNPTLRARILNLEVPPGTFLAALKEMFQKLEAGTGTVNPKSFAELLQGKDGRKGIDVSVQDDAASFLVKLIAFGDEALEGTGDAGAFKAVVGGMTTTHYKPACGHEFPREEAFVPLQVSVTDEMNLQSSIDAHLQTEKLDGYKCQDCQQRGELERTVVITKQPDTLIVQLKRFKAGGKDSRGRPKPPEKVKAPIKVPKDLSIPVTSGEPVKKEEYELSGFVAHSGSLTSGHYWSYAKDRSSKKWFMFNDHEVKPVEEAAVLEMAEARGYLMFYDKVTKVT